MSYTTADRVRRFMDISSDDTSRNHIIEDKIEEVQTIIDQLALTTFEAGSDATRYFDTYADVDEDGLLMLDEWLLSLTSVVNGDGEDITTDTFLKPTNLSPKYAIGLKSEVWTLDDDGYSEDAIAVTGTWGWSSSAPHDIRQAATELAAFLVQSARNPGQDAIQFAEGGQIIVPRSWPPRVWSTCRSYHRHAV